MTMHQPTLPFKHWTLCHLKSVHLLPHLPYSPNLAPANFFLFGYIKEKNYSLEFLSAQRVVAAYKDEVNSIPKKTWQTISKNWFDCMSVCIHRGGKYIE